jgi:FHS family L-fucose permease-like MFS transporter
MKSTITWMKLFPILFGFFVMGFVDVVGIATNYVKKDFFLSDTLANLIPMLVFLWFALCSIPTGMIMNKLGRKNTVLLSMGVTAVAMLLPLIDYNFSLTLLTFALLGIGNTILQVSLNPMIAQVVSEKKMASILTLGQFVKAISSFLGPVIAGIAASYWGNWKLIFVVYAGTTLLAGIWLLLSIDTDRPQNVKTTTSFRSALALFSDKIILWLFIGILAVVGIDVGLNTHIPKLGIFS